MTTESPTPQRHTAERARRAPRSNASHDQSRALGAVLAVYQGAGEVSNDRLYEAIKDPLGFTDDDYARRDAVGKSPRKHCLAHRRVRWFQQELKRLNLVERVPNRRGVWRLRGTMEKELTPAAAGMTLVGFSTNLGLALWSSCDALARFNEPIAAIITSPPYPLAKARRYGGPSQTEMVDFVCSSLEPLVKNMLPGASLVLNVSQDVFEPGSPARSLYVERLTIALSERLGLSLMDRIVWSSNKPPGPMVWASKTRQQLNVGYEPVLWFSNDPARCFADNRRVLQPHTEKHLKFLAAGGEKRDAIYGDGAHRIRAGRSFANLTAGRIARNVLHFTQRATEIGELRERVAAMGLPMHGALMPLALVTFLVKFLTRENDLVVDPFGGWATLARAAEDTGRRWLVTERIAEFVVAQALRLMGSPGFRSSIPLDLRAGLALWSARGNR